LIGGVTFAVVCGFVLVGRGREIQQLRDALDRAATGESSALIVHGEPGIGKTALLEEAVQAAKGMRILSAHPLEAESELSFAGLADLVRPIIELIDQLPSPQAAALSGALALGPPVPGDRFAVAAATLTLLSAAAESAPTVAVIDDAQWLDGPSREALCFAGRRLSREGIFLLMAARSEAWVDLCGLSTLRLPGLTITDSAALLEQTAPGIDGAVQTRIVNETGGNPLALLQALATLSPAHLAGTVPISGPLPVGDALERALGRQVVTLPIRVRQALLIASAADSSSTSTVVAALTKAGRDLTDLEWAERAGVITLSGGQVFFRHPLVRAATYHLHGPGDRRAAHEALAEVALAAGDFERAAWQSAASTVGPNDAVAHRLESVGIAAEDRNAYATAARAFETAADLSPHLDDRLRRSMHAGRALWRSGDTTAADRVLLNVLGLAVDPIIRADLQTLRAAVIVANRPVAETYQLLTSEASLIEIMDPTRAARMLAQASLAGYMAGDPAQSLKTALRAVELAGDGPAAMPTNLALGLARALTGDVTEASTLLSPAAALTDQGNIADSELSWLLSTVGLGLVWIDRDQGYTILDRIVSAGRSASSLSALSFSLGMLAIAHLKRGQIRAAYAAASEALDLVQEAGGAVSLTFTFATLARVEAVLGYELDCRHHVASALELGNRSGAHAVDMVAPGALGLLELSLGHPDRAVTHLLEAANTKLSIGAHLPTDLPVLPDLVEACVLSGYLAEAGRWQAELERLAARTGLASGQAAAARGRGLLVGENDYEEQFALALSHHADKEPFERARTQLCLGRRRRRSGRRQAHDVLNQALSYFLNAGAEPWAALTLAELGRSDEKPGRSSAQSLSGLTSQELQVALVVANGATNKEVAASLFVSVKTVEFHLGNIYRKLSIRSRSELVRRVDRLSLQSL
jgi:DNA-binding CsgD family transcriptional regulator